MKIFFTGLLLMFASVSFAEPYLAVREGLKCSFCHANYTGGGKRTRMGTGYGTQNLPWKKTDLEGMKVPHFFELKDDLISFGGDIRVMHQSVFSEEESSNTFDTDKVNLYLQMKLIPDRLSFYLDEKIAPGGAQAREVFATLHNLPYYGWMKAGKFILPYGLRIEDDRAFIREVTGFNFNNSDIGAEFGMEPGNWTFVAAVSNGTAGALDADNGKQVVASAIYVRDMFRIGASGSYNSVSDLSLSSEALFAGIKVGRASLLGEVDLIQEERTAGDRDQFVSHAEINYMITEGWNVKAAYEYFDPDLDVDENQRDRVVIGVESFIVPFVHVSAFYRFNQSIPQNEQQNADELQFRLHLYF